MPFCPKCRQEFQHWVDTCLDCGVPLVSRLAPQPPGPTPVEEVVEQPPPSMPSSRPAARFPDLLVHVATAPNETEAYTWASVLEEDGIRCLVKAPRLGPVAFVYPWDDHREIHVLARDAELASLVLSDLLPGEQPLPEGRLVEERSSRLPGHLWPINALVVLSVFFVTGAGVAYFFMEMLLGSKRLPMRWVKRDSPK